MIKNIFGKSIGKYMGPLMLGVLLIGGIQGEAQASAVQSSSSELPMEAAAVGFAGEEIIRSLQMKGTDRANYKISEVDADIVLDAVALTVGPEVR